MFVLLECLAAGALGWLSGGIWWGLVWFAAWGVLNLFFITRNLRQ